MWKCGSVDGASQGGSVIKESACQCRSCRFDPWVRKVPRGGNGSPLQYSCEIILWTEEPDGLYSPWGCKDWSDWERMQLVDILEGWWICANYLDLSTFSRMKTCLLRGKKPSCALFSDTCGMSRMPSLIPQTCSGSPRLPLHSTLPWITHFLWCWSRVCVCVCIKVLCVCLVLSPRHSTPHMAGVQ